MLIFAQRKKRKPNGGHPSESRYSAFNGGNAIRSSERICLFGMILI